MIDLSKSMAASPALHEVATDPGVLWVKDGAAAIDVPPDEAVDPSPEGVWGADAVRTGVYGSVSPRVIAQTGGGYRMYYTQIMPRAGYPLGANDYDNATTRILSAVSADGLKWTPEAGVRLSAEQGGAGEFRVVSCEVAPLPEASRGSGRLRMYYECCRGSQETVNSIRSAVSDDGGVTWEAEAGIRFEAAGGNCTSPRIVFLADGRCRLYCSVRGRGILSAVSADGLRFELEAGVRVAPGGVHDAMTAFACDIMMHRDVGYIMYYAGYGHAKRADVLRATSEDGLMWRKAAEPVVSPTGRGCDAVKCSEVSVFALRGDGAGSGRYGMVYEACDGTGPDLRGVWRIAGARSGG
ncbi:MAG: hypothetical protein CMJ49_00400 [Planctomycetaceae bacterium]|nr:hypothetical protein [Planctomycetaceae bacterium]